jgi:23S rRNA pseudouridine1911/1915/1917 synthase
LPGLVFTNISRVVFRDAEYVLSAEMAPCALDRVLRSLHAGASWSAVRGLVSTGKVFVDGVRESEPSRRIEAGARIAIRMRSERHAAPRIPLLHVDREVVVVAKPAGISTVPFELKESESRGGRRAPSAEPLVLSELVARALKSRGGPQAPLGIVHRLDKDTSGVLIFARTLSALRALKQQFRVHSIERRYLALVHGQPESRTISSRLVQNRGDGLRGSTRDPNLGRMATTHVKVLEQFDNASLVECRLETGRTHQIRIHLSERGHPVLGERVYIREYAGPALQAPRLMLHAAVLGFVLPSSGEPLRFELELPQDMNDVLSTLRRAPAGPRGGRR